MSPAAQVTVVAALVVVLLLILAVFAWQQARQRSVPAPLIYGVEDAVSFVSARLDAPARERLRVDGVRRILEWEVFYLQGLAQADRRKPVETVAGGSPEAVAYIADRIAARHGVTYSPADVAAVLRLEAEYLVSIGAVGDPVDGEAMVGGPEDESSTREEGDPR